MDASEDPAWRKHAASSEDYMGDRGGLSAKQRTDRRVLVRFENAVGDGLFRISAGFLDWFATGAIRVPRETLREISNLDYRLREQTAPVMHAAYADTRCRRPVTWFVSTPSPALRTAERLVQMLNRYGADIRRIETDQPPTVLWEDGTQVVTRRPRRTVAERLDVISRRWLDRRKRLERRRQRAGRSRVRAAKAGV